MGTRTSAPRSSSTSLATCGGEERAQATDPSAAPWDTDGTPQAPAAEVRNGFRFRIALGFPHECLEAWIITGFEPTEETRRREARKLGFDPFAHADRLSHKENVPKSAKGLKERLGVGHEQEEQAMSRLVRLVLAGDGGMQGAAFVGELDELLARLVGLAPVSSR